MNSPYMIDLIAAADLLPSLPPGVFHRGFEVSLDAARQIHKEIVWKSNIQGDKMVDFDTFMEELRAGMVEVQGVQLFLKEQPSPLAMMTGGR